MSVAANFVSILLLQPVPVITDTCVSNEEGITYMEINGSRSEIDTVVYQCIPLPTEKPHD